MRTTNVNQYLALRDSLVKEKAALEARLSAINRALGAKPDAIPTFAAAKPGPKPGRRKRAKNDLTMKEAMVKALAAKPLDRQELLKAIQKLGYKFTGKSPLNSLSTLLYTGNAFKNTGGKFSVGK